LQKYRPAPRWAPRGRVIRHDLPIRPRVQNRQGRAVRAVGLRHLSGTRAAPQSGGGMISLKTGRTRSSTATPAITDGGPAPAAPVTRPTPPNRSGDPDG